MTLHKFEMRGKAFVILFKDNLTRKITAVLTKLQKQAKKMSRQPFNIGV